MIYAGLSMILALAVVTALVWWQKWQRNERVLREWSQRWRLAPELCAMPGCLQPPEAPMHENDVYREAKGSALCHRWVPARLVAAPDILLREGIGAQR